MKYTLVLDIDVPRDMVVSQYINPGNWHRWQESLVSVESLGGIDREVGSKTKIVNKFGRKNIEVIETVEVNEIPELFTCTYEAPGAWNRVENRFKEMDSGNTRWEFDSEFKCQGFLKIMSVVMPGMFRRASLKEMRAFKLFVEQHINQD